MFTVPPTINNNQAITSEMPETDAQANGQLQGRFPGWTFINGQYYSNGDPYKAHVRDREGRVWTVWFGPNDQITGVVQGNE